MKSFYEVYQDYLTLSKDDSDDNKTLGKKLVNYFLRKILIAQKWSFNQDSKELDSIAKQQWLNLPYNCDRVLGVRVYTGSTYYTPREIVNAETWHKLYRTTSGASDIPQFYWIDSVKSQLELYPIPSSDGNKVTIYFTKRIKDLSQDDITSSATNYCGTVTISEDGIAVVGTDTAFSASMLDKWIKLTNDGDWYKITKVTSATAMTLGAYFNSAYFGGSGATNAYFTIGERIPLPDGYEDLLIWAALGAYYRQRGENLQLAKEYETMFKEGFLDLIRRDTTSERNFLESDQELETYFGPIDPNLYPRDLS